MTTTIYNAFLGFISPDMILHNLLMMPLKLGTIRKLVHITTDPRLHFSQPAPLPASMGLGFPSKRGGSVRVRGYTDNKLKYEINMNILFYNTHHSPPCHLAPSKQLLVLA